MSAAIERVQALVAAARRLADDSDAEGSPIKIEIARSTGLSPEGVAFALERCLETRPTDAEISALVASVEPADRAHVLLSSSVFVAAHRAIALGLAASETVFVRPSRREPAFARYLERAAPGLFTIVERLEPRAGDVLFAYGADSTLDGVRATLPEGVRLEPHGHGIGAAVVELADDAPDALLAELADALADDVVPFDQRGCLSPRVVLAVASERTTVRFANAAARALERAEARVPRGALSADETADLVRYRDAARAALDVFSAGLGFVAADVASQVVTVAPVGRNLHVIQPADFGSAMSALAPLVTAVGFFGTENLRQRVYEAVPGARSSVLGRMQRPAFDGPVDRRARPPGHRRQHLRS